MINLIPKEEKKKITTDFYFRFIVLFIVMFDFCIFVAIISILPSYFYSYAKYSATNLKLETQKNEALPVAGEQSLNTIKDINKKIDLIENAEKSKFVVSSEVINAILLKKRADIKITQILYESNSNQTKRISILGSAPSREVLLLFRQALEADPAFKSVDLPISNFVKGSNIQFYLSLIPS